MSNFLELPQPPHLRFHKGGICIIQGGGEMPLAMEGPDWTAVGFILGLDLGTGIDRVHILGSVDGLVILEAIIK